ncbi:MAG: lamin tail domain-containing protein [Bacteroidales bacterium]|nr:lamin tail domain-containing protein [Bacteroidales bacterium]
MIARIFDNGRWSAPEEIRFLKKENDYSDLKVTEVHYHPEDIITGSDTLSGKDFEFIEFKNTGDHSINLSGLELDSAVRYSFPVNTLLPPGNFYVITSKPAAFYEYYGLIASGNYQGNLSNAGEYILLKDSEGKPIIDFTYVDSSPWPGSADGDGYSMVAAENNPDGNPNDYFYWRNSSDKGGNPFADNMIDDPDTGSDKNLLHIEAYPNPTRGTINVSVVATEETRAYDMVLTDLTGRVVYQVVAGNQASLDLKNTGVRPGIYTLKVTSCQNSCRILATEDTDGQSNGM